VHATTSDRSPAHQGLIVASVIVVVVAEAVFLAWTVHERGLFEYIGLDYRGSRAAGEAILEHGLAAPYDLSLLEESERRLVDRYTIRSERHGIPFAVVPAPYPPPFTLAFIPSTLLEPVPGFLAWTLFNALLLALYQLRLARAFALERPAWLIVAVSLSLPAFINLIMGQISVWLVVFFGEAVIAFDRARRCRAGLWLGLMIFKPQTLVVVVPALVLARQWRVLAGMAASITALVAPTLFVARGWISGYLGGLLEAVGSTGLVMSIFPSSMTNWRAFFVNAARFSNPIVAGSVTSAAMLATAIAGLACARGLRGAERGAARVAWLGLAAATCAVSWHSHVHQTLMLVPPLFAVVAMLPRYKRAATLSLLATSELFLLLAFTLGFGVAHDVLGLTLLALLVALTAACAIATGRTTAIRRPPAAVIAHSGAAQPR
jgi:hypothetical protein